MITIKLYKENNINEIFDWFDRNNIAAWGWTIGPIVPLQSKNSSVTSVTFVREDDATAFKLTFNP